MSGWTDWRTYAGPLVDGTFGAAFAIGGAINELTGGHTTAWQPSQALGWGPYSSNPAPLPTLSPAIKDLSLYDPGPVLGDGQGSLQVPIVNQYLPAVTAQAVQFATHLVSDTTNAVTKGLLGIDLKTLLYGGLAVFGLSFLKD